MVFIRSPQATLPGSFRIIQPTVAQEDPPNKGKNTTQCPQSLAEFCPAELRIYEHVCQVMCLELSFQGQGLKGEKTVKRNKTFAQQCLSPDRSRIGAGMNGAEG